jgi:hypothetical protein
MDMAESNRGTKASESEETFHFIAYVSVNGVLWELDGLRRQPVRLGKCTDDDWVQIATPRIQERIERYKGLQDHANGSYSAEEIRFNLLAIGPRLLPLYHAQLTKFKELLAEVISNLNNLIPNWTVFDDHVPLDASATRDLLVEILQKGDSTKLMALKKAADRDIALLIQKISDEEDKISEYMV